MIKELQYEWDNGEEIFDKSRSWKEVTELFFRQI